MNVIVVRVQLAVAARSDEVVFCRVASKNMMFVQRRPGAEIVPSKVRGKTENARLALALCGTRLEYSIVDADVLAFWIQALQRVGKFARPISAGNLFEDRRRLGKMLAQGIRERVGAPQKHSAVPE